MSMLYWLIIGHFVMDFWAQSDALVIHQHAANGGVTISPCRFGEAYGSHMRCPASLVRVYGRLATGTQCPPMTISRRNAFTSSAISL